MLLLMDTANIKEIKQSIEMYPIDGVTTNPSIIAKEKRDFIELLKEIRDIIGYDKMLHVQVISQKADEIVEEAKYINKEIGGNLYIKIPVIPEGIKAIKMLNGEIKTTATAVFTPQQALIAAKSGADFVAPYVNRLDNISANGIKVVSDIVKLINIYNFNTKVIAASFKNVEQIHGVCMAGAHAITVNYDMINQMIFHPMTDWSVSQFVKDWENFYGNKKIRT
ncbi:transaldolase family protein [Thermoanaerobacter thermocopriae]|uniref:transaldolase family protein n=1 Tax=Thermoanaerobacter thermocopriae TaxID=29350 RepID=UPI00048E23CF|nr:transaldolase family protein [Thermoanaerobacter thermocopriae]